jgi:hypothetical protein
VGGIDHLLFLLALLARARLAHGEIVAAFAVAHSITLSLAALRRRCAAMIVEPLIAASVVGSRSRTWRRRATGRRWLIAAVFGLVHGLVF